MEPGQERGVRTGRRELVKNIALLRLLLHDTGGYFRRHAGHIHGDHRQADAHLSQRVQRHVAAESGRGACGRESGPGFQTAARHNDHTH